MLTKPRMVFGRDMEWSALAGFAARSDQKPQIGVVSGRRRQGKTYLLQALTRSVGGFYFGATQATEAESLRLFAEALADFMDEPVGRFDSWDTAIKFLYSRIHTKTRLVVIDEFPYLTTASPQLPSILQREFDQAVSRRNPVSVLLCGSAMSVMGRVLAGDAPLRGRANLEIVMRPFDYLEAAGFWQLTDPLVAMKVHSVVGGTAAYREFVNQDVPVSADDFDDWVNRTVFNPTIPLCREARYLLEEETEVPDTAVYHSILAAVAAGNNNLSGISSYVGRKTPEITRQLTILEDCRLIRRDPDVFRKNRPRYRICEPLLTFYNAVMRTQWSLIETGRGATVWRGAQARFHSQVLGPHFEQLCREYAQFTPVNGELPGVVGAGVVVDERNQLELDVVVFAPEEPGKRKRVLSIGETKWGEVMGKRQASRLQRARDLLDQRGFDVDECRLICYSAKGFEEALKNETNVTTVGLADLYV